MLDCLFRLDVFGWLCGLFWLLRCFVDLVLGLQILFGVFDLFCGLLVWWLCYLNVYVGFWGCLAFGWLFFSRVEVG